MSPSAEGEPKAIEGATDAISAIRFIIEMSMPPKARPGWGSSLPSSGKALALASTKVVSLADKVTFMSPPPMQKQLRPQLREAILELEDVVRKVAEQARGEGADETAATGERSQEHKWLFSSGAGSWGEHPTEADIWVLAATLAVRRSQAVRRWNAFSGDGKDSTCGPPGGNDVLRQGRAVASAMLVASSGDSKEGEGAASKNPEPK